MPRHVPAAFTLIELLVVVTIIVILLALLTPALDSAITSAEMAKCGSNLGTLGRGCANYAIGNRQFYPKRQNNYYWDALMMKNAQHPFDIRGMFEPYVGLDVFVDPLLEQTKLDDGSNSPETVVYSNYSVYTGWGVPGFASMDRIGNRFAWQPTTGGDLLTPGVQGALYKFDVLAGDEDYRWPGNYTTASHGDKDGLMGRGRLQDQWTNANVPATVPAVSYRATIAWYVVGNENGAVRGPIDTQFVHEDGSVSRFTDVDMFDDRLAPLVVTGIGEYNAGRQAQVPAVNRGGK